MTTKEVFKEVTAIFKWYAPRSEQWAFSFKRRFAKGQVKISTLEKVFAKFGYTQNEVTWKKKDLPTDQDAINAIKNQLAENGYES